MRIVLQSAKRDQEGVHGAAVEKSQLYDALKSLERQGCLALSAPQQQAALPTQLPTVSTQHGANIYAQLFGPQGMMGRSISGLSGGGAPNSGRPVDGGAGIRTIPASAELERPSGHGEGGLPAFEASALPPKEEGKGGGYERQMSKGLASGRYRPLQVMTLTIASVK